MRMHGMNGVASVRRAGPRAFPGLMLLALIAVAWVLLPLADRIEDFRVWLTGLGPLAPILFALAYVMSTLLLVPGAPMTIAAGLVFGLWGIPLVVAAATIGSALAFLMARHLLYRRIGQWVARRPRLRAVVRVVGAKGWTVVLLLRVSPLIPFNVQNYLLGATDISFCRFVIATIVGALPGTSLFVLIGAIGLPQEERGILEWGLILTGLAATAAVTLIVARRARAELRRDGIGPDDMPDEGQKEIPEIATATAARHRN